MGWRIRPFAKDFLKEMSKLFEIIVFTSATPDYARAVVDFIDPDANLV